jgi:hypothetical protein
MSKTKNSVIITTLLFICINCASNQIDPIEKENKRFLTEDLDNLNAKETFRVLITSERYEVVQLKHMETIEREKDPGGDSYICDEIKKYNKIEETREGMIKIWLYPESGRLMKIRPEKPTYLIEIDKLMNDDIQRWSFKFPQTHIEPKQLIIKYRIVLKKKQTDKEIINEMQKKLMEE